jgi:hypothetical protein
MSRVNPQARALADSWALELLLHKKDTIVPFSKLFSAFGNPEQVCLPPFDSERRY